MRKRRGTKEPPEAAQRNQADSSNQSAVDQDSFFKGLQQDGGNCLHSTALEDQMNVPEDVQLNTKPGRTGDVVPGRKRGAQGGEEEKERKKRTNNERKGRKRPAGGQQLKERASQSADEKASNQDSDPDGAQKNRRRPLSSDEEDDEGSDWNPSPKRTRRLRLGTKSGSDGASSRESRGSDGEREENRRPAGRGGSQLEVVLDAFVDFCQRYRETVESAAVRKSISQFSKNVEVQLLEKISSLKEFRSLKRENTKTASLIQAKTQRLFNAKQELMRAEREASLLEKKKVELRQRLADLRRGQAFLQDIRELTTHYLAHRRKNPAEKEKFGGSSLAALLLETKLRQRPIRPQSTAADPLRK